MLLFDFFQVLMNFSEGLLDFLPKKSCDGYLIHPFEKITIKTKDGRPKQFFERMC